MLKNFLLRQQALWHPEQYHGWGKDRNYFEGWYFKLISPDEQTAIAVIPGISKPAQGEGHAFIQVLDGIAGKAHYHQFALEAFQPATDRFALQLGDNFFSTDAVELNLPDLKGKITLHNRHPWPKTLGAPGIMGWYSFVPFMECYHGVLSVHHSLEGSLELQGKNINFSNGIGYCEKDWGRSFPSSWVWMQSNHFDTPDPACLMISVARIPWMGSHFVGFIGGWLHEGTLHRFSTYSGAKLKVTLLDHQVRLNIESKDLTLEILGTPGPGATLLSPISGQMTGKVNESLQGKLDLKVFRGQKLIYEGQGRLSGLELAGDIAGELGNQA